MKYKDVIEEKCCQQQQKKKKVRLQWADKIDLYWYRKDKEKKNEREIDQ